MRPTTLPCALQATTTHTARNAAAVNRLRCKGKSLQSGVRECASDFHLLARGCNSLQGGLNHLQQGAPHAPPCTCWSDQRTPRLSTRNRGPLKDWCIDTPTCIRMCANSSWNGYIHIAPLWTALHSANFTLGPANRITLHAGNSHRRPRPLPARQQEEVQLH